MPECPTFLKLPARATKPRSRGITHVLDSGLTPDGTRSFLGQAGHLVDIVKVGWGIGYIDPCPAGQDRPVRRAPLHGVAGRDTARSGRDAGPRGRTARLGPGRRHLPRGSSDGLCALPPGRKQALIRELAADFAVLAETGAKEGGYPPTPADWGEEMARDLDAGAAWVIAEGRESGTVGLYRADYAIVEDLVEAIARSVPVDKVIFEAPRKNQQAWFVRQLGAGRQPRQRGPGQRAGPGNPAPGPAGRHRLGGPSDVQNTEPTS